MGCCRTLKKKRCQCLIWFTIVLVAGGILFTVTDRAFRTLALGSGHRTPNSLAEEWTDMHNIRREYYHKLYGGEYAPLKWSDSIADDCQKWADKLAAGRCSDYRHDPDNVMGENLAVIWGDDDPERVMTAWVEEEELGASEYYRSGHGHMTQALWRATKYVGCAQTSNSNCHIYVCRYVRPGNCNRGQKNWLTKMMEDTSPCKPFCPEEGCF